MSKEQIIFRCPFYDKCPKDEPLEVYADNEIIIDIPAPECGHPFLLYKYTGDPLCQLTFDPDDPEFNLERYSETVLDHVRLYKKPLKQRLKEIFGGKK